MTEPGPFRPQLDAAVAAVGMEVDRENVLAARAALLAEADRLDDLIAVEQRRGLRVGLCGGDPVSPEAATAFNDRIDALLGQCSRYNQDLREAARALDSVARSYGWTEDEIAASFQGPR
ncbi:MAG: WXG100 family type VII secretion target [Pseudonocardia sp.]